MPQVAVHPQLLTWALQRSGRDVAELEHRFKRLGDWLSGTAQPTLRQLEDFARATRTPLGALFLDAPPTDKLPIPLYRTISGEQTRPPSVDLIETLQSMEYRQMWVREFLETESAPLRSLVGGADIDEPVGHVAEKMRAAIGLPTDWARKAKNWEDALRVLSTAIENAGIFVVVNGVVGNDTHRTLDPAEFRGFVLADPVAPLIFVNGADPKDAQLFTLAHELAHIVFGHSAAFDLHKMAPAAAAIEQACDAAAEEFLLPEREFRARWPAVSGRATKLMDLRSQLHMSEVVIARRAFDLHLIAEAEFDDTYDAYVQAAVRKNSGTGGNFHATQPYRVGRRFGGVVVRALTQGKLLYTEAYRLTGLHGTTFDEFAAAIAPGAL